jgi:hypothetical protein
MKSPIQITLKRSNSALSSGDYIVTKLKGAISVWQNPTIRVGDVIAEKTAESLTRAYTVTVII